MKTYTIKLEDKAAFLSRLEKAGVVVNTDQIEDNKTDSPHSFTISFENESDIEKVNNILNQSPKINKLKELLRKIIREELSK